MTNKPEPTAEQIEFNARIMASSPEAYTAFVTGLTSDPVTYNLETPVRNFLASELQELARFSLTLDHAKRVITYGDKCRVNLTHQEYPAPHLGEGDRLLLHGLLGKVTEALELVPILLDLMAGRPVDITNLLEELADDEFYEVLVMYAAGLGRTHSREVAAGFDVRRYASGMKLGKRYKGGVFSKEAALGRDLGAERENLEKATAEAQR